VFTLNRALAAKVYPQRAALRARSDADLRDIVRKRLNVPAVKKTPRKGKPGAQPALLAIGIPDAELEKYRQEGYVVRRFDPPQYPAGRGGYTGAYQAAAREWLYGRTLLGNLVGELTGVLSQLAATPAVDPKRITIWGRGNHAVTAKLLAALEAPVEKVIAENGPESWYAFTQNSDHQNLAEIVVPGVLLDFDLPDLARLLP
jgi:hypothetical protein